MIGQKVLHYQITEKLGEGGMGVVYRAKDTKLERDVALKFLPPHTMVGEEEKARFRQESQAAASLDHPNICTVHEINEVDGQKFIVMAYVDGKSLEDLVRKGPLPLPDVLDYGVQIAEGLQAAHEKGIVHRDIKPANILTTEKKQVRISDFGLAKAAGRTRITREGVSMGTIAYMSPEQARGTNVDHRTDIWALGVVLYEMLTGRLPFPGDRDQAMVYSILNEEPEPPTSVRSGVPMELERIVLKALAKEPGQRYQHIDEMAVDLKVLRHSGGTDISRAGATLPGKAQGAPSRRPFLFLSLALVGLLIAVVAYYALFDREPDLPEMKIERITSFPGQEADPALSPDGQKLAFCWEGPERSDLDIYVQLVDAGDPVRLTDDPRHEDYPRWSPDGSHIAFSRTAGPRNDEIYLIPALGGSERLITSYRTKDDGGICWSADGESIFFSDETEELGWRIFRVDIETEEIEQVTTVPPGEENLLDYTPRVSPDGSFLAFVRRSPATSADLYTLSLADGEVNRLTFDDLPVNGLAWTPDSRFIVFNSNRDGAPGLWKVSATGGQPQKIAVTGLTLSYPDISLAGNRLVYYEHQVNESIWKVNLDNPQIQEPMRMATQHKHFAKISPDASRIAYSSDRTGSYDIWICDIDGGEQRRLTKVNDPNHQAISWSPDGQHLVFSSMAMGIGNRLYVVSTNGGQPRVLTENAYLPGWSRDSKWIYLTTPQGMFRISLEGEERERLGTQPTIFIGEGWNGEFLYTSRMRPDRVFGQDLWRMPIGGGEEELVMERDNYRGTFGSWVIGREGVYYVDYPTETTQSVMFFDFNSGTAETLFEAPEGFDGHLDVSPDEKWLIYLRREQTESDIIMIENFR